MTRLVQVAVAADLTEAEEIQTMLHAAGIRCELEPAVEHHPTGLEDAQAAIEELSEPDEFLGDE
jgi:hypothetical protein